MCLHFKIICYKLKHVHTHIRYFIHSNHSKWFYAVTQYTNIIMIIIKLLNKNGRGISNIFSECSVIICAHSLPRHGYAKIIVLLLLLLLLSSTWILEKKSWPSNASGKILAKKRLIFFVFNTYPLDTSKY